MLFHARKVIHILDVEIGKVVHDLDFVVWKAVDDFPETGFVGEIPDLLHPEIGKMINLLDPVIWKTADKLNTSVDLGDIDMLTRHAGLDACQRCFIQRCFPATGPLYLPPRGLRDRRGRAFPGA